MGESKSKKAKELEPIFSDCDLIERLGPEAIADFNERKCVYKIASATLRAIYYGLGWLYSAKFDTYSFNFHEKYCIIWLDTEIRLLFKYRDYWWHIEELYNGNQTIDCTTIQLTPKCNEQLCLLECIRSGKIINNIHNSWTLELST